MQGEGDYAALLKARRRAKAAASLNLKPTIRLEADQPRQVDDGLTTTFRAECPSVEVNDDCQSVRDVAAKAKTEATLIYLFCNGSLPPSAGASRPERLELDQGCLVSVDQIGAAPVRCLPRRAGDRDGPYPSARRADI